MSSAFYPLGMNSYNNRTPQGGYKSWKGTGVFSNPVGITAGNIRPLTNNDPTNNAPQKFGLPRPIQHYRKGIVVPTSDLCNGQQPNRHVKSSTGGNLVRQMIDTPGNYIVKNNATSLQQGPPNYQNLKHLTQSYSTTDGEIRNIKMSFDGKYQIATTSVISQSYFITSNDYGNNWNKIYTTSSTWGSAISYDGKYQFVVNLYNYNNIISIYLSSNYGSNFQPINLYVTDPNTPITFFAQDTSFISCDGKYMTIACQINNTPDSYVITSTDYGVTWNNDTPYKIEIFSVVSGSMSSTGKYQSLCGTDHANVIHISSDYGQTWIDPNFTQSSELLPIRVSTSGQYQTTCSNDMPEIYYSLDYGNNWNTSSIDLPLPVSGNWSDISMIGTGQYQVVIWNFNNLSSLQLSYIYMSSDYGQSWSLLESLPQHFISIAISGLGDYLSLVTMSGVNSNIYTSHAPFTQTGSLDTCNNCFGIGIIDDWKPITNLTENPEPETQTQQYCCNQERNALRRVRPTSTRLKKNYYITTNDYLYNRCQTFEQQQFNYLSSGSSLTKPGAPLSQNNMYKGNCNPNLEIEYAASLLPDAPPLTPSNPLGCEKVQYKPNNYKYAQQGAVSSSDRLLRLNVETIDTNRANIIKTRENLVKSKYFLNASGKINGDCCL